MPFPDSETVQMLPIPIYIPRAWGPPLQGRVEFAPFAYPLEDGKRQATLVLYNGAVADKREQAIIERECGFAWDAADARTFQRRVLEGRLA